MRQDSEHRFSAPWSAMSLDSHSIICNDYRYTRFISISQLFIVSDDIAIAGTVSDVYTCTCISIQLYLGECLCNDLHVDMFIYARKSVKECMWSCVYVWIELRDFPFSNQNLWHFRVIANVHIHTNISVMWKTFYIHCTYMEIKINHDYILMCEDMEWKNRTWCRMGKTDIEFTNARHVLESI